MCMRITREMHRMSSSTSERIAQLQASRNPNKFCAESSSYSKRQHLELLIYLSIYHELSSATAWTVYKVWYKDVPSNASSGMLGTYPGRNHVGFCVCGEQYSEGLNYHCYKCKGRTETSFRVRCCLEFISRITETPMPWIEYITCEMLWKRKKYRR